LRRAGFAVSILTADGEPDEWVDGVQIISCVRRPVGRIRALLFATQIFLKAAISIDADIYQVHSPELLPLAEKLKKRGKKVVYDAHEDMPNHILEKDWIPRPLRSTISKLFSAYMYRTVALLDEVISPHFHVVNGFRARIQKGVVISNFPIVKDRRDGGFADYSNRIPRICYTGTAYPYSNQCNIAEAVQEVDAVEYTIAGFLDDSQLEAISSRLTSNRFTYLGRLSQAELTEFYQTCVAGVVIYDYKLNLGWRKGSYGTNKIFEYMEAGLPVICTDFELWADIVRRFDCGICVAPGEKAAIVAAIRHIVEDPRRAYEMGRRGREAVEREFNWRSEERKYNEMISDLSAGVR
jgi:glycosyltransferase involved in cell wall biosynthesis